METGSDELKAQYLEIGDYVVICERPCKIAKMEMSENGAIAISGTDVLSDEPETFQTIVDKEEKMTVFAVALKKFMLHAIEDGNLQLEDLQPAVIGRLASPLPLPEGYTGRELKKELAKGSSIVVNILVANGLGKFVCMENVE